MTCGAPPKTTSGKSPNSCLPFSVRNNAARSGPQCPQTVSRRRRLICPLGTLKGLLAALSKWLTRRCFWRPIHAAQDFGSVQTITENAFEKNLAWTASSRKRYWRSPEVSSRHRASVQDVSRHQRGARQAFQGRTESQAVRVRNETEGRRLRRDTPGGNHTGPQRWAAMKRKVEEATGFARRD